MRSESIDRVFPIYSVENDIMIAKNGDVSIVYELKLPQIYSLNGASLDQINIIFDKVIRSLPENTILQKQDFFFTTQLSSSLTESDNSLARSDNRYYYEKPIQQHKCFLILTKDSKSTVNISSTTKETQKFIEEVGAFVTIIDSCVSFLNREGYFVVERQNNDQIIELLGMYFSLSKNPDEVLKDIFFDKGLQVGDNIGEIYSITTNEQLPPTINNLKRHSSYSTQHTNFMIPFIQPLTVGLDCNHLYNQVVYVGESGAIFANLKIKLNHFNSLGMISKENLLSLQQVDELVSEVIANELMFVYQHFSLIIWDKDSAALNTYKNTLSNIFRDMNIDMYQTKLALKDIYLGNSPGGASYLSDDYKFIGISEQTPTFMNFESYYGTNYDGIILCDRKSGAPLRVDLWDEPVKRGQIVNRNRLIFGPSGTGKSFLVNHIASQYYEQGHHVVMIDIGNSYKKLCQLKNGQYYNYDPESPLEFNPFVLNSEKKKIDIDKKTFLISLIMFIWKGDNPYTKEEKQIMSLYIDGYYVFLEATPEEFPSMSGFYNFVGENRVMEDEELYFDKVSFQLSSREFHDGKYAGVLNSKNPVDLVNERFIVFEMDNIKDHPILFPLVTMLCIDLVMDKLRNRKNAKKSIFIDECWKPISKGEMAEFIKYLYKTVRKFYGEIAIATQDVEDILQTEAGPAMINNTDTMILLSHKKKMASKDKFAAYLSFNESDLEKLFSTNKREVFIKIGGLSNVYSVDVSPERYACYTSNADENKRIFETYDSTNNMDLAINQFVEDNNKN